MTNFNNPLPKDVREEIKRITKFLTFYGVDVKTAHEMAYIQVVGGLKGVTV